MKTFTGTVVSTKMQKTVVIERVITRPHPLYKKVLRRRRRVKAASDIEVREGDVVKFASTRPISKDKHFRVVEKI